MILYRWMLVVSALVVSAALTLSIAPIQPLWASAVDPCHQKAFLDLVDQYVDAYYFFHPIRGPESGIHTYDLNGLGDMSSESLDSELRSVKYFQRCMSAIPSNDLDANLAVDYHVLSRNISARLNELEITKNYARDPYVYADIVQTGILFQMLFQYPNTTLNSRLLVVLKQIDTIPALMKNAVYHLQSVPKALIAYGISSLRDTRQFLKKDVQRYFAHARLPDGSFAKDVLQEKISTAAAAMDRLIEHLDALRRAPGPKPPFALGEKGLAVRLRLKEGIILPDVKPFEAILARTLTEIEENRNAFINAARGIDPEKDPREVWEMVQTHHPKPGEVVGVVKSQVEKLIGFLKDRDIVAIPEDETVTFVASPAFMLYYYATMWQTGPFESSPAPPGVYYVSDPKGIIRDEEQQNEFLKSMVTPELWTTSAHEAYPGHFIQGYALKKVKRRLVDKGKLSKVAVVNIFAPYHFFEGWAHYCEQMVREEGFRPGGGRIKYREYLLGQRSDALLRLSRTYAGIRMHLGEWTPGMAAEFFEKNAFMSEEAAKVEAQRGTYEPDYILYAIGKSAILDLRSDYKKAVEAAGGVFSLGEFHNRLLSLGQYSVAVLREKMLRGVAGEHMH